jgi:hypothetical protein
MSNPLAGKAEPWLGYDDPVATAPGTDFSSVSLNLDHQAAGFLLQESSSLLCT